MRWVLTGTTVVALTMATVGCASTSDNAANSTTSSATTTSASPAITPSVPPAGYVSRATWTAGPWPLTVEEAVLECQGNNLVTLTAGNAKYSLNAAALSQTGLPDYAETIGVPDPDKPGFHLDAGPLIQRGLALCRGASTAPSTPTVAPNRPAGLVERATWTDGLWPLTVDSAVLQCNDSASGPRVTIVADREMYALNGTAKSANLWPPFDAIWADDPNVSGVKAHIGPMLDRGLALCG